METPAIIRSGWWVAVAAVGISAVVATVLIVPIFAGHGADHLSPEFVLAHPTVPRELIVRAMARDGVHILTEPGTIGAAEIDRYNEEERGKLLVSDDRVIGIAIGGEARAYPLRLMRWHEVVNDVVGGTPIAVTYSPLCDSVAVFSRTVDDATIELGVSGLLYQSNTLVYDRGTKLSEATLWSQLTGRPVAGPDPSAAPALVPMMANLTTWGAWRDAHPDTLILAQLPELNRLYKRDPYHSYFGSDLLRFPVDPLPPSSDLRLKDRVVVVTIDGVDQPFALSHLAQTAGGASGASEVVSSGLALRIRFRLDPGVATVEPLGDVARLQAVRYTFWFAWHALAGETPRRAMSASHVIDFRPKKGTIPGTIRDAEKSARPKSGGA